MLDLFMHMDKNQEFKMFHLVLKKEKPLLLLVVQEVESQHLLILYQDFTM